MRSSFTYIPLTEQLEGRGYECHQLTELDGNIDKYRIKEGDVVFARADVSVNGCQLIGKRNATKLEPQEDQFGVGMISGVSGADKALWERSLTRFVSALNDRVINNLGSDAKSQGATLCMAVCDDEDVYVASVGDSRCYTVIWDADGKIVECERINKELHNAKNDSEVVRVAKHLQMKQGESGVYDRNKVLPLGRLGRRLEMTRAIGDRNFEKYGLSHECDFFHKKLFIPSGGGATVIITSDGMTEGWEPETSGKAIAEAKKMRSVLEKADVSFERIDKVPFELAREAMESGSADNTTILVKRVGDNAEGVTFLFVTDGHNGAKVSSEVQKLAQQMLLDVVLEYNQGYKLKS